jgi:type IV secretion system protein VirB5
MNAHVKEHRPEEGLGEVARDVELRNIRLRGDKTFEIAWHEEEWQDGQRIAEADYTGSFVVEIEPPSTAEAILKNPLGLYIVEFGWSPDRSSLGG